MTSCGSIYASSSSRPFFTLRSSFKRFWGFTVSWNNWRFLSLLSEGELVCISGSAWRVLVRGAKISDEVGLGSIVSRAMSSFIA